MGPLTEHIESMHFTMIYNIYDAQMPKMDISSSYGMQRHLKGIFCICSFPNLTLYLTNDKALSTCVPVFINTNCQIYFFKLFLSLAIYVCTVSAVL